MAASQSSLHSQNDTQKSINWLKHFGNEKITGRVDLVQHSMFKKDDVFQLNRNVLKAVEFETKTGVLDLEFEFPASFFMCGLDEDGNVHSQLDVPILTKKLKDLLLSEKSKQALEDLLPKDGYTTSGYILECIMLGRENTSPFVFEFGCSKTKNILKLLESSHGGEFSPKITELLKSNRPMCTATIPRSIEIPTTSSSSSSSSSSSITVDDDNQSTSSSSASSSSSSSSFPFSIENGNRNEHKRGDEISIFDRDLNILSKRGIIHEHPHKPFPLFSGVCDEILQLIQMFGGATKDCVERTIVHHPTQPKLQITNPESLVGLALKSFPKLTITYDSEANEKIPLTENSSLFMVAPKTLMIEVKNQMTQKARLVAHGLLWNLPEVEFHLQCTHIADQMKYVDSDTKTQIVNTETGQIYDAQKQHKVTVRLQFTLMYPNMSEDSAAMGGMAYRRTWVNNIWPKSALNIRKTDILIKENAKPYPFTHAGQKFYEQKQKEEEGEKESLSVKREHSDLESSLSSSSSSSSSSSNSVQDD